MKCDILKKYRFTIFIFIYFHYILRIDYKAWNNLELLRRCIRGEKSLTYGAFARILQSLG